MTSQELINKAKELLAAATPGPWKYVPGDSYCAYPCVVCGERSYIFEDHGDEDCNLHCEKPDHGTPGNGNDAEFIAFARNHLPDILALVELNSLR